MGFLTDRIQTALKIAAAAERFGNEVRYELGRGPRIVEPPPSAGQPRADWPPAHAPGTQQIELELSAFTFGQSPKSWWGVISVRQLDMQVGNWPQQSELLLQLLSRIHKDVLKLENAYRAALAAEAIARGEDHSAHISPNGSESVQ